MSKEKYTSPNIRSVETGLPGNFSYSPFFLKPIASALIDLTGYRRKDYKIAEIKTGECHIPKKTVWHHCWNGSKTGFNKKAELQLIDWDVHQNTIPHAGACKQWWMNGGKKYCLYSLNDIETIYFYQYKYLSYSIASQNYNNNKKSGWYTDIVIDALLDQKNTSDEPIYKWANSLLPMLNRKLELEPFAIDPYGNIIYSNEFDELFFLDIERMKMNPISPSKKEILSKFL